MRVRFGECLLDSDRRELHRGGEAVAIEPQVFDLLVYLIEQQARVVSRDDLIAAVWGGRIVSESTLTSRINAARRAIGDSGERQALIRTIPRKGFRFVADLAEERNAAAPARGMDLPPRADVPAQEISFCRTPDGVSLAWSAVGRGPPLVKVANWLTHLEYDWSSPVWAPLLHRLSADARLVRYDGRGSGLSDRAVDRVTFDDLVRDLETVIDAAGVEKIALFGMSQGAAVAIAYAVAHPERVSRLILYGAYAQGRNRRRSPDDAEMAQAFASIMRLGWGDPNSAFMRIFSALYLPSAPPELIKAFADLQRVSSSPEFAMTLRATCDDIDVSALLPRVRVPTLVLHCRHDSVSPFEQGRSIATVIPRARLVTLESDNHVVLPGEEAWQRLVREIELFIGTAAPGD